MKHVRTITVAKASSDTFAIVFFQIWLSVFTWLITGAFTSKR